MPKRLFVGNKLIGGDFASGSNSSVSPEDIVNAVNSYLDENPVEVNPTYYFQVGGTNHTGYLYVRGQGLQAKGITYNCVEADVQGIPQIKYCGQDCGTNVMMSCTFIDENSDIIPIEETYEKNKTYRDVVINVPANARKVYINGSAGTNGLGAYLQIATTGVRSSNIATQSFLNAMWNRWATNTDTFAWMSDTPALLAFTFDDTNDEIYDISQVFFNRQAPICYGCIPDRLGKTFSSNGNMSAAELMRQAELLGGEVLAHGSDAYGIVNESTIDDKEFLFRKFVMDKQKFIDHGFNVRGIVRVGGNGKIDSDPRTELWVKTLYDYSDLYGTVEPYNHARVSCGSSIATDKAAIDRCVTNKGFMPLLYHNVSIDYITEILDYALEYQRQGLLKICTYAYAYDNYGTTKQIKALEDRIKALENS